MKSFPSAAACVQQTKCDKNLWQEMGIPSNRNGFVLFPGILVCVNARESTLVWLAHHLGLLVNARH